MEASLIKSYSMYRDNANMVKIWPFLAKTLAFFAKIESLRVFIFNFQMKLWVFLVFGIEVIHKVFFEKKLYSAYLENFKKCLQISLLLSNFFEFDSFWGTNHTVSCLFKLLPCFIHFIHFVGINFHNKYAKTHIN